MEKSALTPSTIALKLRINGVEQTVSIDTRNTLLDALRDIFELPGTKKGCDRGACGACTVIVDGQRVLSCLTLAATCGGRDRQCRLPCDGHAGSLVADLCREAARTPIRGH